MHSHGPMSPLHNQSWWPCRGGVISFNPHYVARTDVKNTSSDSELAGQWDRVGAVFLGLSYEDQLGYGFGHPCDNYLRFHGPFVVADNFNESWVAGEEIGASSTSLNMSRNNRGYEVIMYLAPRLEGVHGDLYLIDEIKPFADIKFTLAGTLTTSDQTVSGTIVEEFGWGRRKSPFLDPFSPTVTLYNREAAGGGYSYEGVSGAYGYAKWDKGDNYKIYDLECP